MNRFRVEVTIDPDGRVVGVQASCPPAALVGLLAQAQHMVCAKLQEPEAPKIVIPEIVPAARAG